MAKLEALLAQGLDGATCLVQCLPGTLRGMLNDHPGLGRLVAFQLAVGRLELDGGLYACNDTVGIALAVLLDFMPEFEIKDPVPFVPRPAPNGTELAVKEASRTISRLLGTVSDVSSIARNVEGIREDLGHRLRAAGASLSSGWLSRTDKTPLNGEIGPARWFDWILLPISMA